MTLTDYLKSLPRTLTEDQARQAEKARSAERGLYVPKSTMPGAYDAARH